MSKYYFGVAIVMMLVGLCVLKAGHVESGLLCCVSALLVAFAGVFIWSVCRTLPGNREDSK